MVDGVLIEEQEMSPEQRAVLKEEADRRAAMLEKVASISNELVGKRKVDIEARTNSGIEDDWKEDEEFYEGIDDANREFHRGHTKPLTSEGGPDSKVVSDNRSRVFLNITRPYVDAAAAKVADMLLPTDDQNWGIEPTPISTLVKHAKDKSPLLDPNTGAQMEMQVMDPDTGQPMQKKMTVADQVQQINDQAKDAAKAAERRIDDWLSEANYNNETRKCIEFSARIGTGIMKGPVPVERRKRAVLKEGGLIQTKYEVVISPDSKAISPWGLYPDASCGNDIHKGSHIWEVEPINARGLKDLMNDESYIQENIAKVLREGPDKKYLNEGIVDKGIDLIDDKESYDIWFYYGFLGREEMEAAGCECDEFEQVPAIVEMVNDTAIKFTINPDDTGAFPYDVMPWQARSDHWAGIGVARQIRTPQRMLNGAARQMMDNAGLSSGPQIVVKRAAVEPENGSWKLEPRKIWIALEDYDGPVQDAFTSININSMMNELMGIIQFAIKMAEDVTGLPMLIQGQQGKAPETVGGMQMLNNNASTVLRRIARTFDDNITEPHIRRYYDWLLADPDVPPEEKGDFNIVARGSSALVERDIQNQAIGQMAPLLNDPEYRVNKSKWFAEYSKAQKLDPRLIQYTEEEWNKIQETNSKNPPVAPEIQVAQMQIQGEAQKHEMDLADRAAEREHELQLRMIERDTAALRLAQEKDIKFEDIKAKLFEIASNNRTKKELFNAEAEIKNRMGSGV
jgi:hypothetical protein